MVGRFALHYIYHAESETVNQNLQYDVGKSVQLSHSSGPKSSLAMTRLGMPRVRGTVCAQEEARVAAGGGGAHGPPVLLALQDRQAESMRPQTALSRTRHVSLAL